MSKVREVTPKVLMALSCYPETRGNDKELVLRVYKQSYGVRLMDSFGAVLMRKDLPSFESIRRARQRIQAECPELRAEDAVKEIREEERKDYVKFSKEELK